jgi:toxin CcdB
VKQFDVYENPSPAARRFAPFLVVLSSHLLLDFDDAVVAPLVNDSHHTVAGLELDIELGGDRLVLVITEMSSIEGRALRHRVGSLAAREDDIRGAFGRLFTGF